MKLREAELKPGGQMVLVNFAKCDEGHFLGKSGRLGESMHHTFAEIWAELVTPEEFTNTNFPNQYRTLEATTAPFAGSSKELSMDLVSADPRLVPCPYYDSFHGQASKGGVLAGQSYAFAGDASGHADNYVPTTRTWSNSTFLAGLDDGRSDDEKAALVDELFRRYAQRVADAPKDHAMDYTHVYLHAAKPLK